jgi:hypothetical protein
MTRLPLVAATLIAAAVYQTQSAAARDTAARRVPAQATADCVRAPAEGAYASAPYTKPPCLPNSTSTY